jgi:hypothetical protein
VVQRTAAFAGRTSGAVNSLSAAALETGHPHCYLKHSASNQNDRISIVARDGAQVVVRFADPVRSHYYDSKCRVSVSIRLCVLGE